MTRLSNSNCCLSPYQLSAVNQSSFDQ